MAFQRFCGLTLLAFLVGGGAGRLAAGELDQPLQTIRAVAPGGRGHREAAQAWKQVAQADAAALPAVLAALDNANPLAANWLRGAVEAIAERELHRSGKLPAAELEAFLLDTRHDPRGRRLAYEWLAKVDAAAPDRLIPKLLNDPSVEFRRDAVQRLLSRAKELQAADNAEQAKAVYQQALQAARDEDQVEAAVQPLAKLGEKVDLPRHFGFLMDWRLIGPFDNSANKGFDVPYPPEQTIDLDATYVGQKGEVAWTKFVTQDKHGIVDLAKAQAPHKGAATYAYTEFTSDAARDVEIRIGTPNAWKVWVNGKCLFGRDEFHRGMQIDQYRVRAALQPGKNQILLKVCQNEQTEDWAQRWQFQARVCDSTGTAVLSTTRPASVETAQNAASK
jgi:hypothetical protein